MILWFFDFNLKQSFFFFLVFRWFIDEFRNFCNHDLFYFSIFHFVSNDLNYNNISQIFFIKTYLIVPNIKYINYSISNIWSIDLSKTYFPLGYVWTINLVCMMNVPLNLKCFQKRFILFSFLNISYRKRLLIKA